MANWSYPVFTQMNKYNAAVNTAAFSLTIDYYGGKFKKK